MAENKNRYILEDEDLGSVSGGALRSDAYSTIDGYIRSYKSSGYNKNDLKTYLKGVWGTHSSVFSTNGHPEDLDALLKYIDLYWSIK